jgi:EAL domain-containing protein (putative c-di-GMP-specific phosphodiesterase class I)
MASSIKEKQFQVHYQPKNDLKTGKVIGAEALVRWISPERGLISPLEFIPLFERNGLITQLDQYVWEQVCKDLREWKNKGIDIPHVSVNVSRIDVLNPAIGNVLNKLIGKYGLKHSDLHLEITESAYTYDSQTLVDVVQCLRSQGFILEMDDFGKGFSSLSMLSSLPINILKLDMDLVRSGNLDDRKSVVLGFVISLARELGIPVIAEGVETREQAETPCRMGCDFARGYYYSRPLPRDAFEAYLKGTK